MSSSILPTANDATNSEAQEAGTLPPQDQHELGATPIVADHSTPPSELPSELPSTTAASSTPNVKIETDEFGNETPVLPTQVDVMTPFVPEKVSSTPNADKDPIPSAEPSPSKLPSSTSENNFLSSVLNATTPTNHTSSLNFGSAQSGNENRDFDFSNFNFDFESLNGMFSSPLNGGAPGALAGVSAVPFPVQNGSHLQTGIPQQPPAESL